MSVASSNTPKIDDALVKRLIFEQFPQWGELPIFPVDRQGWDNQTFRIGDKLIARLPSAAPYAPQVSKEQTWLPVLANHLNTAIPTVIAEGQPSSDYPFNWTILEWIEGEPANLGDIRSDVVFAENVAQFLRELHTFDASEGPLAGDHSFHRGAGLAFYEAQARQAFALLPATQASSAEDVWEAATAHTWTAPPVWVHGDMLPGNLLTKNKRLVGVIDFGCCAVGDPACDLAFAWNVLTGDARSAFISDFDFAEDVWKRAKGWALWKSAILATKLVDGPAHEKAHASFVLNEVLEA